MVKKIAVIVLGIMIITIFCSFLNFIFGEPFSEKRNVAFKITKELSKKYKSKYGLRYMGISEEGPGGKYKRIGLLLSCNRILGKDEGRKLLLNCVKEALNAFNSSAQFRPYMENYPFNEHNITINIYIRPPNVSEVFYPDIAAFSFFLARLEFKTKSPENLFKYFTIEEESYEEALRIVEAQQRN